MKIAVMGYSGSGKSTMARRLGALYGCPVLHLDTVQFTAGWQERPREEARGLVAAFLDQNSGWVIDGNYSSFCQQRRLAEADAIVYFAFPRFVCLFQAVRRYLRYRGRTREDMADGCQEKMDWEFARWILWDGRSPSRRRAVRKALTPYKAKCVTLYTRRQADRFFHQAAEKMKNQIL